MRRQEEERVRLKKKLEDWTKEQEEEKRQREATKRQQEAREAEEQRKAELSASTARLRAARDEQLKKLARNEEDLQHMREAAADIDRQRILAAALAAQPKPITTVNLEDEFELGADAAGFTPVRPRKKSTPSKQTPDSANRRPATPHRRAPLQSAMKKTVKTWQTWHPHRTQRRGRGLQLVASKEGVSGLRRSCYSVHAPQTTPPISTWRGSRRSNWHRLMQRTRDPPNHSPKVHRTTTNCS